MIRYATVTSINPFTVRFDGEIRDSPKIHKRLSTYSPTVGDRVVFTEDNGKTICLGTFE